MANRSKQLNVGITPDAKAKVEEMAGYADRSQSSVIEAAINILHQTFEKQRAEGERQARAGAALFEKLKTRLGADFYKGHGGVGFEPTSDGRVHVHVDDVRYFEEEGGRIMAERIRGGRVEYATVAEDGINDWLMMATADPTMN